MELKRCPQCDATTVIEGELQSPSDSQRRFLPRMLRSVWWGRGGVVACSDNACACYSCGLIWTTVRPIELRAVLERKTDRSGRRLLRKLERGPCHDLPEIPEAELAGLRVAAIEIRMRSRNQTDAAILVGEFLDVDAKTARTVIRYWDDRTRAQKLALFGWQQSGRARLPASRAIDHPMRDDELDGVVEERRL